MKLLLKIFIHVSTYTYQDAEENKSLETTVPGWGGHPNTGLSLVVGCGGVLAFILGRARLPSSCSTPFSKTCAESNTAQEAQTFSLYAKRYKNN